MAEMGDGHVACTERPEGGEIGKIAADRLAVFHAGHHDGHAVAMCLLDFIRRGAHARVPIGGVHGVDRLQHRGRALYRGLVGIRRARPLADIGGETPGGHVAALHFRQVDLAARVREEARPVREGDIDMGIDGEEAAVQRKGVGHTDTVNRAPRAVKPLRG